MIVCVCRVVSDQKIRATIDEGAKTVEAVGERCRAGTGCGACRPVITKMLAEAGVESACSGCPGRAFEISSPYLETTGEAA